MQLVETYVKKNLSHELSIVQSNPLHVDINLTIYEKTLIYKYSDDGFRQTNKALLSSKGTNFDNFGILLSNAISKLPNFRGITYRKVFLTTIELNRYIDAFKNQHNIIEYPFVSTSKFITLAISWSGLTKMNPNCLFVIYTKTGKEIEQMSKYHIEREVLLKPNTQFNVLNIFTEPNFVQITMEEVL